MPGDIRPSARSGDSSRFDLTRLRAELKPFRLHWFPRLRSTNDHAAVLRKRGDLYAPAVVLTGHQTAGRGRGEHSWWSRPGVLTVTFVFPVEEHLAPHQIPLIAGLAVRDAAAELTGDGSIQLKWPNDVLHMRRKLAGLLCERVHRADLIGVGLNVNLDPAHAPAGLRERVTSLSAIAGHTIDMTLALLTIARHLRLRLAHRDEHPFGQLLREYDTFHALVGQSIQVIGTGDEPMIAGRCEGLDSMGRLLIRDRRRQLHRILAGQVAL